MTTLSTGSHLQEDAMPVLVREHLSLLHTQHASSLLQVRVLVHTDVTKYLEFKAVDGSYVLSKGRVEKVPATDYEALRSPLLGLFEKRRLRSFLLCAPPAPRCRPPAVCLPTQQGLCAA